MSPLGKTSSPTSTSCGWQDDVNHALLIVELMPHINRVRVASVPHGGHRHSQAAPLLRAGQLRDLVKRLTYLADVMELGA